VHPFHQPEMLRPCPMIRYGAKEAAYVATALNHTPTA